MEDRLTESRHILQIQNHPSRASHRSSCSSSHSALDVEEVHLEYTCRKKFREHRLSKIEEKLGERIEEKARKRQNIILFWINLAIVIFLSFWNAYYIIELGVNEEMKATVMLGAVLVGFICSLISNLMVTSWK